MKAAFYLTLLDGLLATAVYQPQNSFIRPRFPFAWSVPLRLEYEEPRPGTTVTWIPPAGGGGAKTTGKMGMRTSATPVCGYRLSLHD